MRCRAATVVYKCPVKNTMEIGRIFLLHKNHIWLSILIASVSVAYHQLNEWFVQEICNNSKK